PNFGNRFNGVIDELSLYNRALTQPEIQRIFAAGGAGKDKSSFLASDLTIAKSHSGNLTQGQTGAAYTVIVSNIGQSPTSGTISVVDTPPVGLTATDISGSGWTCTLGILTCTRADALAVGASYPAITVTVNVAVSAPAALTNTVTVSGGGEVNTGND